ncbi:MAG TPA: zf-HC2 domain-containing protein [Candidatus Limnocylindria bacterium]|nr:zf-HC2 domain-containing protein [Candidatus Limnocylindria bacterium]
MHLSADLSAYLDGALGSEARAGVEAHLAGCALCRVRLAELRETVRLLAALPVPSPTRSLVPRVAVPVWLAPLRTLSTIASGAAIFLFVASAMLSNAPFPLTTTQGAPAAAPAPNTVPAATGAAAERAGAGAATASPDPAKLAVVTPSPTPAPARSVQDASREPPRVDQATAAPATPAAADSQAEFRTQGAPSRPQLGPSPWLWLALAIGFGALALVLQGRLRSP